MTVRERIEWAFFKDNDNASVATMAILGERGAPAWRSQPKDVSGAYPLSTTVKPGMYTVIVSADLAPFSGPVCATGFVDVTLVETKVSDREAVVIGTEGSAWPQTRFHVTGPPARSSSPESDQPYYKFLSERVWTRRSGKNAVGVQGVLTRWDDTYVWLLARSGARGRVRIRELSPEDQLVIQEFVRVIDQ